MKKFICAAAVAAVGIMSTITFGGCKAGDAYVDFTLSEDGTYYIVSGVSGDKHGLTSYDVPAEYSAEEGGELLPVKEIGTEAFYNCRDLAAVTLPDTVEIIGERAFAYTGISSVTIPDSVTQIKYAAFGACESLTEITIPESVTVLESRAFAYCTGLEKAYVKADVTDLKARVFYNSVESYGGNIYTNTSLTEVYLPATLQKIHSEALFGNAISDIYFAGTEEQWNALYFYKMELKEGAKDEYEEKKVEKDKAMSSATKIHYNAEF